MKKAPMRLGYWLSAMLVKTVMRLLFGLQIRGIENVPLSGRLLFVSNHVATLDPPIVGAAIPREVYFAAKIQLFKGLIGKYIRYHNAIPIRRSGSDKEAIRALSNKLKENMAVLIFPEGTRSRDTNGIAAKAGVGLLARMSNSDLLPIRIDGTIELKKALFRRGGIKVTFGKVIHLAQLLADNPHRKEAYRRITEAIMDKVRTMRED